MSRRLGTACLVLGLVVAPSVAHAGKGSDSNAPAGCQTIIGGETIVVECEDPGSSSDETIVGGVSGAVLPCRWVAATAADGWDPAGYGDISLSGYVFGTTADGGVTRTFPDGRVERVFERECPGGVRGFTWVDTSITIDVVIDDAVGRASRRVPVPSLDVSPSPEAGGIVNLGLWLSLSGQDPVTVRAEAGLLWAQATVSLVSTRWEMGNGDVVECEGAGVPIVNGDTLEEGPCGYTYRVSSPEDEPFVLSVTASWAVSYRSSGGGGSAGSVDRTVSVDYDVDEIQTVGVSN